MQVQAILPSLFYCGRCKGDMVFISTRHPTGRRVNLQYFHPYLFYHPVNNEELNSEDAGGGETEFSRVTSMDVGKNVTSCVG